MGILDVGEKTLIEISSSSRLRLWRSPLRNPCTSDLVKSRQIRPVCGLLAPKELLSEVLALGLTRKTQSIEG